MINENKKRYALLDEFRGFMVFCMIFFHGFYVVYDVFEYEIFNDFINFFMPAEPFFAGGFIMLSGVMCGFSKSNIKRGAAVTVIAAAVTVVTVIAAPYIGEIQIYFGILHLLGISMLFCGIFDFALKRIPKWFGLCFNAVLFAVGYFVFDLQNGGRSPKIAIPGELYENGYFSFLGIAGENFSSADYFPIFPWIFIFIFGYYLYKFNIIQNHEKLFLPERVKPLGWLGRHALAIYIIHQPVCYAASYLIKYLLKI